MAKYAERKKLSFDGRKSLTPQSSRKGEAKPEVPLEQLGAVPAADAGSFQIRSKKSARLLATAICKCTSNMSLLEIPRSLF